MIKYKIVLHVLYGLEIFFLGLLFKGIDYPLLFSNLYSFLTFNDYSSFYNTPQLPDYYLNSRRFGFTNFIFNDLDPIRIKYCGSLDRPYFSNITASLLDSVEFRNLVSGSNFEDFTAPSKNLPCANYFNTSRGLRYYALSGKLVLLTEIPNFSQQHLIYSWWCDMNLR